MISVSEPRRRSQRKFYIPRLDAHGINSSEAVGWPLYVQERLFRSLVKLLGDAGKDHECSLLDIGCGLGDLYNYLLENGYTRVHYTGIDILPEMVRSAREKNPGISFHTADFLNVKFKRRFDFTLCSGSMNIITRNPGHEKLVKAWIRKMYSICRYGSAFNLLASSGREYLSEDESLYYADPGEIMSLCREFCPGAECDFSDFAYTFTVFCPRAGSGRTGTDAFNL